MQNFTAASVREAPDVLFQGVNVVMGHQADIVKAAGGYVRIVISNGHSVSKAKYRMVARLSLAS
jgi:hypothetical protein